MAQGEAGEIEAMRLLDEYDKSRESFEIPKQPIPGEDATNTDPADEQNEFLF